MDKKKYTSKKKIPVGDPIKKLLLPVGDPISMKNVIKFSVR